MKLQEREDAGVSSSRSIQEAEYAVLSSIAVREKYKAKLHALLSIIDPHTTSRGSILERSDRSLKLKQKTAKSVELQLPEILEGKEIHVLGDLLLLMRATSVDVVENVQVWRETVHQGLPRPYIYENTNYLLIMCEDLDFLDHVEDLVEWLGFCLVRNPFIVAEALDNIVSSRLGKNVQDDRSLKYWCSSSWRHNMKLTTKQRIRQNDTELLNSESRTSTKNRWRKQPPPKLLVKPLASIQPEDDVVDGSRIEAAHEILLEEESFHGRLLSLKVAREYVNRGPSHFSHSSCDDKEGSSSVYAAIAALNLRLKKQQYYSSLLRRERAQVERTIRDVNNQTKWTELCRDCDHTKLHPVWHCRDKYRQEALTMFAELAAKLQNCIAALNDERSLYEVVLDKQQCRMSELREEKDKQRVARHDKKRQEEVTRRDGIRKKTVERGRIIRANRIRSKKQEDAMSDISPKSSAQNDNSSYHDIAMEVKHDIRLLEARSSVGSQQELEDPHIHERLEEKRHRAIGLKRARLVQQERIAYEKELELDECRAENVAMKHEDFLVRVVERQARKREQLRSKKIRMDRVAASAIFKCTHEMNRKRFLISIYVQNARGYDQESLRIMAYEPGTSTAFTMVMTLREFNSLGYGKTSDGLGAFCKWLCLLYEKRRRQFRLVWSGTQCPPALRIRENDQTLVCIHKEGVKMRHMPADSYSLVAVYLRTDKPSMVRFVMSSWHGHESLLTEYAIFAKFLVHGSDLDIRRDFLAHATIVWKHDADTNKDVQEQISSAEVIKTSIGPRVYSGETMVDDSKHLVHIYDTSTTEYLIELIPKSGKSRKYAPISSQSPSMTNKVILAKREVNPYGIQLPSSSFADLLTFTRFEEFEAAGSKRGDTEPVVGNQTSDRRWKATVSPKWTRNLANYVRVLRLAKYACKVGGVFCFVALFVVQQKSEFRAHLLLEITWLSPTSLTSISRGGVPTRQSLRIALSDYLRCINATRRFMAHLESGTNTSVDGECHRCLAYSDSQLHLDHQLHPAPDTQFYYSTVCSNCATIQYWRLHAIRDLITHVGAIASESLELIYHGYCELCSAMVPPIVLTLGLKFSAKWLIAFLEHYFVSIDMIAGENTAMRENVLHALKQHRVAVLFNANCGMTVSSANAFVHELHWWLYPEHEELPCHVAYIVGHPHHHKDDTEEYTREAQRDFDLLEAMKALNHAAVQVGEQSPVHLDDGGEEETDRASAFDAYLVAEAMLVEATRILLHPEYVWHKPREIVGASSWSAACSYLLDPHRLSADLQQYTPLVLNAANAKILEAYFSHPSWPHDYHDVRPVFYGLLAFMMHLEHVFGIIAAKSGSLQNSSSRHSMSEKENVTKHEFLAANTSVIDCSYVVNTTEALQHEVADSDHAIDTKTIVL